MSLRSKHGKTIPHGTIPPSPSAGRCIRLRTATISPIATLSDAFRPRAPVPSKATLIRGLQHAKRPENRASRCSAANAERSPVARADVTIVGAHGEIPTSIPVRGPPRRGVVHPAAAARANTDRRDRGVGGVLPDASRSAGAEDLSHAGRPPDLRAYELGVWGIAGPRHD